MLLGTGSVGRAFLARCLRLRQSGVSLPAFGMIANSRVASACGRAPETTFQSVERSMRRRGDAALDDAAFSHGDIVVDATASDAVASCHASWLSRGVHVVTANKLGAGAALSRAQAIAAAQRAGTTYYGDAATVGAGLPLLRSIRALIAGGDRIHRIEGVLSGSLAWLFDRYDGVHAFSDLVRQARADGYTEPDPRIDLSGEDVRRKLLILARAAGWPVRADAVRVDSLLPDSLACAETCEVDARLGSLDAPLSARFFAAHRDGAALRFIGRIGISQDASIEAHVCLQALTIDHPLHAGRGTDNRVAIYSDRYKQRPLLIQGPGAGPDITAAALLDDALQAAERKIRHVR
ncbi:MAG: homoserine dehydrogenase [Luteimonas sp.]